MAKILVAGRSGQVAQSLAEAAADRPGMELVCLGRPDLDIADLDSVKKAFAAHAPDLVINAAAYTAVDQAETDRDEAYAGNEGGPKNLAEAASAAGVPLFHISTDYVFDGEGTEPYEETDPVSPLGVYGSSKLAGEEAVLKAHEQAAIFRTAWVYGVYGKNFLKTMLRLAADRDELGVVADQRGAPTSSHDIAKGLLDVAEAWLGGKVERGIYHMTAGGEAVWADFAEAIFEESAAQGGPSATIRRIPSSEFPTPAKRPSYSVLSSDKLAATYDVRLPHWRDRVAPIVARVLNEGS
ncbi:dTDP-4-dehydrorhamnose reductase [Parvularcula maris]|uniref:dTDP-4-dehydrorhamnose reductase n=1 Tax=Parvularcula maris TaxID=2965077 RepID=A0A9X2RHQ1_9PROT|nr:dTDP-4-dehydrorhamnose reductase [Parvularcula maris]MCQ8184171.1 dTDP-4-dehydrorhamnose reductase [Parvularcula maris]